MKLREKILSIILFFLIILSYVFLSTTKYDQIDISGVLATAMDNLSDNQELIVLNSKNPFNFYDILNNLDDVSNQEIYAIITYPDVERDKYPVVIGFAGSLGWAEHHKKYLDRYLDMGIAIATVHSFKSRGVSSTVGEQVSVTTAMMIHDAYMLLEQIDKIENLDSDKVAITGWSLGGGVTLFSAWKPIQEKISPDLMFAGHLSFYPPCLAEPENHEFTDAPIHILIGELDTWVPAEPCRELIQFLKEEGYKNVEFNGGPQRSGKFKNAHHSFDRADTTLKIIDHAYSLIDCRLSLSSNGVVKTKEYGFPLSNSMLQKIGLYFCADRGPIMGGNDEARVEAMKIAEEFMRKTLLQ